jgi:hypothetical protein
VVNLVANKKTTSSGGIDCLKFFELLGARSLNFNPQKSVDNITPGFPG